MGIDNNRKTISCINIPITSLSKLPTNISPTILYHPDFF